MKNNFLSTVNNLSTKKHKSKSKTKTKIMNETTHCDQYAEAAIYGYDPEDVDSGEYTPEYTPIDDYHERTRKACDLSVESYYALIAELHRRLIEKDTSF